MRLSYDEAVAFLDSHTNLGVKPGLERIEWLAAAMGHPEEIAPVVHITGTNGKTTTARLMARILQGSGLRSGTYTSPHLERVNERIAVDCEPLSDERFTEVLEELMPYLDQLVSERGETATYFEITTAMGFVAFADAPVSVEVLEVGMGGRWDASNIATAEVAAITNVSVDHSEYLGDDPLTIAGEKAGIIKADTRVVLGYVDDDVANVVKDAAAAVGAEGLVRGGLDYSLDRRALAHEGQVIEVDGLFGRYEEIYVPLHGAHQALNASIAIASAESLLGAALPPEVVSEAAANLTAPGRIEVLGRNPLLILDGAHNPAGAEALVDALEEAFIYDRMILVAGISAGKDRRGILEHLAPLASVTIATQTAAGRATAAEAIAREASNLGCDEVRIRVPAGAALEEALETAAADDLVVVTGSLYVVGEARTRYRRIAGE